MVSLFLPAAQGWAKLNKTNIPSASQLAASCHHRVLQPPPALGTRNRFSALRLLEWKQRGSFVPLPGARPNALHLYFQPQVAHFMPGFGRSTLLAVVLLGNAPGSDALLSEPKSNVTYFAWYELASVNLAKALQRNVSLTVGLTSPLPSKKETWAEVWVLFEPVEEQVFFSIRKVPEGQQVFLRPFVTAGSVTLFPFLLFACLNPKDLERSCFILNLCSVIWNKRAPWP